MLYGLAAASIAVAIIFDGGAKLLLIRIIKEPSYALSSLQQEQNKGSDGLASADTFVYKKADRFNGDIQYQVVKPDKATLYLVPAETRMLYQYLNGWIPITIYFLFTWAISLIVLRKYYQRQGKIPKRLYIILILPIVFYMLRRSIEFYTLFTGTVLRFEDLPNPYLFRIIFRIGVIGGSILFGLAFFLIARITTAGKIKDCLTIAAIGATMIGISLSPSALQQTYGVAGRSLMLVSSLLFCLGFYLFAVYISRDTSIRKQIRSLDKAEFLQWLGHAQLEIEVENRVKTIARGQERALIEESGVAPSTTVDDYDIKLYINEVLKEVKKSQ